MDLGDAWESNCYKEWVILSSGSSRCSTNLIIPILLLCSFSNEKGWLRQTQPDCLSGASGGQHLRRVVLYSGTTLGHGLCLKEKNEQCSKPQVGCFIIEDYDTVLATYMGSVFFSQDKDPYDKAWEAKVATEHLENAFVKGAVSNEAPGNLHGWWIMRWSRNSLRTTRKACTQLLAQFKTFEDLWSNWIWWETGENRPCWVWCGTWTSI